MFKLLKLSLGLMIGLQSSAPLWSQEDDTPTLEESRDEIRPRHPTTKEEIEFTRLLNQVDRIESHFLKPDSDYLGGAERRRKFYQHLSTYLVLAPAGAAITLLVSWIGIEKIINNIHLQNSLVGLNPSYLQALPGLHNVLTGFVTLGGALVSRSVASSIWDAWQAKPVDTAVTQFDEAIDSSRTLLLGEFHHLTLAANTNSLSQEKKAAALMSLGSFLKMQRKILKTLRRQLIKEALSGNPVFKRMKRLTLPKYLRLKLRMMEIQYTLEMKSVQLAAFVLLNKEELSKILPRTEDGRIDLSKALGSKSYCALFLANSL